MEVKFELTYDDMEYKLWSGARKNWVDATEDQRKQVWDMVQDVFMDGDIPTMTEVNDFVWFDCDDIFNGKEESDEGLSRVRRCNIRKKNERLESDDEDLGIALDKACKKHAEVGFASINELRQALNEIKRSANKLGCALLIQITDNGARYEKQDVDSFCKKAARYIDDDTFIELSFIDDVPGNNYALTLNDYDGNMEEFADLVFIPFTD